MGDIYYVHKTIPGTTSSYELVADSGRVIIAELFDTNTGNKCIRVASDVIIPLYSPTNCEPLHEVKIGDKVMLCEAIPSDKTIAI